MSLHFVHRLVHKMLRAHTGQKTPRQPGPGWIGSILRQKEVVNLRHHHRVLRGAGQGIIHPGHLQVKLTNQTSHGIVFFGTEISAAEIFEREVLIAALRWAYARVRF